MSLAPDLAPHVGSEQDGSAVQADVTALVEKVLSRIEQQRTICRATYRLQFHLNFTFQQALEQVDYLRDLGISHLYASPYLKSRPNSVHGYDVCEHDAINPELGGEEGLNKLVDALRAEGMGHIVDIVPNHASATTYNPWWTDILENGRNSPFSGFFDIDWEPIQEELRDKVLLPILGQQYGAVLESGQLTLIFQDGSFSITYFEHRLPLGPRNYLPVLSHELDELRSVLGKTSEELSEYESILASIENLPRHTDTSATEISARQREKEIIKRRLRELCVKSSAVEQFIQKNVTFYNGTVGEPGSFDPLDDLLKRQSYRLCHWRAASDEINYRRFFDINELAALCMESPDVFHRAHALTGRMLAAGRIDGVRIDHIDGLLFPEQYLWRLQWLYVAEIARRIFIEQVSSDGTIDRWPAIAAPVLQALSTRLGMPRLSLDDLQAVLGEEFRSEFAVAEEAASQDEVSSDGDETGSELEEDVPRSPSAETHWPLYVVIEKILGADEPLPEAWPTAGTTGYDFLTTLGGLFIPAEGLKGIVRTYELFLKEHVNFDAIAAGCKQTILKFAMASELQMLAQRAYRISEQHRRSRDFTLNTLRHVLREILVFYPVYRAYPGPGGVSDRDRRFVQTAVARAKRRNPTVEPAAFEFIQDLLLLKHPAGSSPASIAEREMFAGRFQQVTSPVMAKGVEDTAFYVYCPLLSANEVGGEPRQPLRLRDQFHRENEERAKCSPLALLATSTHDTKRSEDVRSRISVLAEMPHRWRKKLNAWSRTNRALRREVDGQRAPSRNDEYIFYQTLLGIWPIDPPDRQQLEELTARVQQYMEKASHEAKQRTSWINPNGAYDESLREFIGQSLLGPALEKHRFLKSVAEFHEEILDYGLYSALSQTTLKLTSPGVPDIYQGQELWDFSLVDPDNRRPVNYSVCRWLLGEVQAAVETAEGRLGFARMLAHAPRDSRSKLFVTSQLLLLRREYPELFSRGKYVRLSSSGKFAEHIVAFARRLEATADSEEQTLVVVVPRFIATLMERLPNPQDPSLAPLGQRAWEDTAVTSTASSAPKRWRNIFTGVEHELNLPAAPVSEILRDFPVAVLLGS